METCKMVLQSTFESADEILRCDNSIETFSAISLSWYTVFFCFSFFSFGNCVEIWLWSQLGLKWLRPSGQVQVMLYCIRAERPKTTPCVATCSLFSSTLSWYFYYSHWHLLHVGVLADSESEDESSQDEKRRKKEKKSSKKKKRKSRHKKKRWQWFWWFIMTCFIQCLHCRCFDPNYLKSVVNRKVRYTV